MVTLGVIPARVGSKRVPEKNKRALAGRPLVAWTIEAAIQSSEIDHVIVSTDDKEINEIGLELGAINVGLRTQFTDDHAPTSAATIDAVKKFVALTGVKSDFIFQLLPTCPLRSAKTISRFWTDFQNLDNPRSAMSCAEPLGLNPNWAIERRSQDNSFIQVHPARWGQRSQDLPSIYFPSGAIWCAAAEELLSCGTFDTASLEFIEISALSAFDIDTFEEFRVADLLMRSLGYCAPP